ncbi:hypothetical protein [Aeromonas caviae]|uniref:hypothetical protein n=1 Tax=Aeromonas caviae TaxID=648 RepID=UPI002AB44CC8|nr:hypothetical protein [Aeromonas caviae]MDY7784242.1 hypothetical protein [Aeromonas caviae]
MANVVYTLKIKKETQEMHLFEATPKPDDKCTPKTKSICKKMSSSESEGNKFACQSESSARIEIAKIGRSVCGTCVSSLYETY